MLRICMHLCVYVRMYVHIVCNLNKSITSYSCIRTSICSWYGTLCFMYVATCEFMTNY